MAPTRLHFIDWMKSLGILLIVYGHVGWFPVRYLTAPVYPKQIGVALILFCAGYSLARETRPGRVVLFNRLFEVYLLGICCALVMSIIGLIRIGDPAESNYLPFLLGLNVGFNSFPANPTTWFIGTYIHLLLIWAIALRKLAIRPWMLVISAIAEVAVRAALEEAAGLYVAYMALTNWATVFLLGLYCGQKPLPTPKAGLVGHLAGWAFFIAAWPALLGPHVAEYSFPFMRLTIGPRPVALIAQSSLVTAIYLSSTILAYRVTERLPAWSVARFVARNTTLVFIAHMPVLHGLSGPLGRWTQKVGLRVVIQLLACYLALAMLSEIYRRAIRPQRLRDALRGLCLGERHESAMPPAPSPEHSMPGAG